MIIWSDKYKYRSVCADFRLIQSLEINATFLSEINYSINPAQETIKQVLTIHQIYPQLPFFSQINLCLIQYCDNDGSLLPLNTATHIESNCIYISLQIGGSLLRVRATVHLDRLPRPAYSMSNTYLIELCLNYARGLINKWHSAFTFSRLEPVNTILHPNMRHDLD